MVTTPTLRSIYARTHAFAFPGAAAALAVALVATGCSAADSGSAEAPGAGRPGCPGQIPAPGSNRSTRKTNYNPPFGIDIDTASYNFARRQILDGRTPDPALIRPEEFINAFKQDFASRSGDGYSIAADGAQLPSQAQGGGNLRFNKIVRVDLQTRGEDRTQRRQRGARPSSWACSGR